MSLWDDIVNAASSAWDTAVQNVKNYWSSDTTYDTSDMGSATSAAPAQEEKYTYSAPGTSGWNGSYYDTGAYDYGSYTSPAPTYNDYVAASDIYGGGSSDSPSSFYNTGYSTQAVEQARQQAEAQAKQQAYENYVNQSNTQRDTLVQNQQSAVNKAYEQALARQNAEIAKLKADYDTNLLSGSRAYEEGFGLKDIAESGGSQLLSSLLGDAYGVANATDWLNEKADESLGWRALQTLLYNSAAGGAMSAMNRLTDDEQTARELVANSEVTNAMLQASQDWQNDSALTGSKAGEFVGSIGGQLPNIVTGALGGEPLTLAQMGLSVFGNSSEQALQNGHDLDTAALYGLLSAGKEVGTELLSPGVPGVNKETSIGGLLGESAEEFVGEMLDPFIEVALMDNSNGQWKKNLLDALQTDLTGEQWEKAAEAGVMGTASAAVMQGASALTHPVYTANAISNAVNNTNDYAKNSGVQSISNQISEMEQLVELHPDDPYYKNALSELQDIRHAQQETFAKKLGSKDSQANKAAEAANADLIRETAKEYGAKVNDSQLQDIIKVANKTGVTVEFTDSIDFNGAQVDGLQTEDGKVLINANASDPVMTIFAHEITHSTENTTAYDRLSKTLTDMANSNQIDTKGIDSIKNSTLDDATKASEITATLAQNVFGNDESINRLAERDPNLLRYIAEQAKNFVTGDSDASTIAKAERKMQIAIDKAERSNLTTSHTYTFKGEENNVMNPMDAVEKVVNSRNNSEHVGQFGVVKNDITGKKNTISEMANYYDSSGDPQTANVFRNGTKNDVVDYFEGTQEIEKHGMPRGLKNSQAEVNATFDAKKGNVYPTIDDLYNDLNESGYHVLTSDEFNTDFKKYIRTGSELGEGLYVAIPDWSTVKQPSKDFGAIGVFTVEETDNGVRIDRSASDIARLGVFEDEFGERPKTKKTKAETTVQEETTKVEPTAQEEAKPETKPVTMQDLYDKVVANKEDLQEKPLGDLFGIIPDWLTPYSSEADQEAYDRIVRNRPSNEIMDSLERMKGKSAEAPTQDVDVDSVLAREYADTPTYKAEATSENISEPAAETTVEPQAEEFVDERPLEIGEYVTDGDTTAEIIDIEDGDLKLRYENGRTETVADDGQWTRTTVETVSEPVTTTNGGTATQTENVAETAQNEAIPEAETNTAEPVAETTQAETTKETVENESVSPEPFEVATTNENSQSEETKEKRAFSKNEDGTVNVDKDVMSEIEGDLKSGDKERAAKARQRLIDDVKSILDDVPSRDAYAEWVVDRTIREMNDRIAEDKRAEGFRKQARNSGVDTQAERGNDKQSAKQAQQATDEGDSRGYHEVSDTETLRAEARAWLDSMGHDRAKDFYTTKEIDRHTAVSPDDIVRLGVWFDDHETMRTDYMKEHGITVDKDGNYAKDGKVLDESSEEFKSLSKLDQDGTDMKLKLSQIVSLPGVMFRHYQTFLDSDTVGTASKRAMLDGKIDAINRDIDKFNKKWYRIFKADHIDHITDAEWNKFERSSDEAKAKALEEIFQSRGEKIPSSASEILRDWAYFSMLCNLRTHAVNTSSNFAMQGVTSSKNFVAYFVERAVANDPKLREHLTRQYTSEEGKRVSGKMTANEKAFAKADYKNNVKNEFEIAPKFQDSRTEFAKYKHPFWRLEWNLPGKFFQKWSDINSKMLEVEDDFFTSRRYNTEFTRLLKANGYEITDDLKAVKNGKEISKTELKKYRTMAFAEACETTFHDINETAKAMNTIAKGGKAADFLTRSLLPFKATPFNMFRRMGEYSPLGLAKSIASYENVIDGKITANEYVNGISKGITGTSMMLVGSLLAHLGILRGRSDDDWKEKAYKEDVGLNQDYSFVIPKSVEQAWKDKGFTDENIAGFLSVESIAPAFTPLLVGATAYETITRNGWIREGESWGDFLQRLGDEGINIVTSIYEPIIEQSFMQGVSNQFEAIKYADDDEEPFATFLKTAFKTYALQYFPSMFAAINRTIDPVTRTTYSPSYLGGLARSAIQKFPYGDQLMAKATGDEDGHYLEPLINVRGEEVQREGKTIAERAVNNLVNPFKWKTNTATEEDYALLELYDQTHNSAVLPYNRKTVYLDNVGYELSPEGRTEVNKEINKGYRDEISALLDDDWYDWDEMDYTYKSNLLDKVQKVYAAKAQSDYFTNIGLPGEDLLDDKKEAALFLKEKGLETFKAVDIQNIQNDLDSKGETIKNSGALRKLMQYEQQGVLDDIRKDIVAHKDDSNYAFNHYGLNATVLGWSTSQISYQWQLLMSKTASGERNKLFGSEESGKKDTGNTNPKGGNGNGNGTGKKKTDTSTKTTTKCYSTRTSSRKSSSGSSRKSSTTTSTKSLTASLKSNSTKSTANNYEKALSTALGTSSGGIEATQAQLKKSLTSAMKSDQDLYDEIMTNHKKMVNQLDLWGV